MGYRQKPGQSGNQVIQIVDEGGRWPMVEPTGKVLHVQRRKTARGRVSYVYLELRQSIRRLNSHQLAKKLGLGAKKVLSRSGPLPRKFEASAHRVLTGRER